MSPQFGVGEQVDSRRGAAVARAGFGRRAAGVALLALAVTSVPVITGQHEVHASPVTVEGEVDVPLPTPDEVGEAASGVVEAALSAAPAPDLTASGTDSADTDLGAASSADEVPEEDLEAGLQAAQLPSGAVRTEPVEAPMTFSMLGFELPEGVDELYVRTSADGEEWSDWVETERVEDVDGPDPDSEEAAGARTHAFAEPVWAEEANYFQVELPKGVEDLAGQMRAELIDSVGYNGQGVERRVVTEPADQADAAGRPRIISRAQWGANESWAGGPSYARDVTMGVVHHTATSNSYSDASAVMRSMYHYHTQSLGWKDLGYNIVIDRAGNVYEGRKGGLEAGVIGAHAAGFNTGSFGVSVIGNYENANPTAASMRALEDVIAWQSSVYGIDPNGTTSQTPDGARRATIVGHRQVGQTACPGRIQNELSGIRARAAQKAIPFADVSGIHREAVLQLADDGIINGCGGGRYCPGDGLTRGQMASLMARALDLQESSSGQRFPDVPSNHPHRAGIHALVEAGVISGYPDGTFRPQADVQRDQMGTFLTNGLELRRGIYQARFADVLPGNPHARAVEAAAREEITNGCNSNGTRYCPSDTLRRDQAASLLHRALYLRSDDSGSGLLGLLGSSLP